MQRIEYVAFLLPAAARLAVLIRILGLGLIRKYPLFVVYMVAGLLQISGTRLGDPSSLAYARWWVRTTPFLVAASIGAVLELWKLAMSRYDGIGRIYSKLIPLIAALCVGGTIAANLDAFSGQHPSIYRSILLLSRYTAPALSVICLFLCGWTLVFREQVPRNVKIHAAILGSCLATSAVGNAIVAYALHGGNRVAGEVLTCTIAALLLYWAALINQPGEIPREQRLTAREIEALEESNRNLEHASEFLRFRP